MGGGKIWAENLNITNFSDLSWTYNPTSDHGITTDGSTMNFSGKSWQIYNAKAEFAGQSFENDGDQLTLSFTVNAANNNTVTTVALYNNSGAVVCGASYNVTTYLGTTNETGNAVSRGYAFAGTNNNANVANITNDVETLSFGTTGRKALSFGRSANTDYTLTFTIAKVEGRFVGTLKYSETDKQTIYLGETFSLNGISITFDGTSAVTIKDFSLNITASVDQTVIDALQRKIDNAMSAIYADKVGYPNREVESNTAISVLRQYMTDQTLGSPITATNYTHAQAAYNNVLALTDINLPKDGKAYKLNFLHNNNDKTKRYIKYDAEGLGLTTESSQATTILFKEVDATNHKYIMTLTDGNLITWRGDGNEGFKVDGSTAKGYSTMVANQENNDDWNLCWFANQGTSEDEFGTIKMISPRHVSNATNSCWVISNAGAWAKANESSFFQNNGATSALQFEEVADVTSETTSYKDGVEKYTLYTTAVANNETYAEHFGNGLGKYHYGDNQTTGYMDAVKACTTLDQERNIVNSIAINLPENGFYRFKGHINARYITSSDAEAKLGLPETRANDATEIFYVAKDGEQYTILNYTNGLYWNVNNTSTVGGAKSLFTFREAINNSQEPLIGQYWIQSNNSNNDVLQPWNNGEPQISNAHKNFDDQSGWDIEKVTDLPISIATSGYTTMYSPVSLTLPGELEAYTASVNEQTAVVTYTKVSEVPANTGVLLYRKSESATTHNLGTNGITGVQTSSLLGQAYTQAYDKEHNTIGTTSLGTSYVYTLQSGKFKWYTGTKLTGFKAHLELKDGRETGNARTYTFSFDDNDPTGITEIDGMIESNASIYDLSGRKMTRLQKGINIVNGKKVIR